MALGAGADSGDSGEGEVVTSREPLAGASSDRAYFATEAYDVKKVIGIVVIIQIDPPFLKLLISL